MIAVGHGLNEQTGEFEGNGNFDNVTGFGTETMGRGLLELQLLTLQL